MLTATKCCDIIMSTICCSRKKVMLLQVIDHEMHNRLILQKGTKTILQLTDETKINRWTLSDVFHQRKTIVSDLTFDRLSKWLNKNT